MQFITSYWRFGINVNASTTIIDLSYCLCSSRKAFLYRRDSRSTDHLSLSDQPCSPLHYPTSRGSGPDRRDRRYLPYDLSLALRSSSDPPNEIQLRAGLMLKYYLFFSVF